MATDDRPLRILGVGLGVSINFLRWAARLAERGHEVHFVTDRLGPAGSIPPGVYQHDIRTVERLTRVRGLRRLRLGPAIGTLAERLDADLVHAHYLLPYGVWAAHSGRHPLVVSPWGTDILVHARDRPRDAARARRAFAAADWVVVNSRANRTASVGLGARPDRIRTIVWYSELDTFAPDRFDTGLRARLGWPEDALVVLSPRKFLENSNLDVLVEAFARVAAAEPRARLIQTDHRSDLRPQIEALIDRLGIRDRVAIFRAADEELPGLVAAADVLCSITSSDSTPASLLEAMASGLPAVCGRAPSIDEWVEQGDGAELVPPRDVDEVAAALARVLADPELRRRYGERNRRVVHERLSDPGEALERFYREVLNEGAAVAA